MKKREKKLKVLSHLFCRVPGVLAMCVCASSAFCAQAPNPRSSGQAAHNVRDSGKVVSRSMTNRDSGDGGVVSRGAIIRRADNNVVSARAAKNTVARSGNVSRGTIGRSATVARSGTINARSGVVPNVSRSAVPMSHKTARSASNVVNAGGARLASGARATAVFSDVSKIGGGYAQCRESYATCMDQFCANANDTYRRCYCSSKFTEFRDTEMALDEAKVLLQQFEDNNLNAVDKTAAEVNAMYSATVGEAAIKNDVSGAQSILNEIGDLLSGKKKAKEEQKELTGLIDVDDIWGDSGSAFDIFSSNDEPEAVSLEGLALYNQTHKQCLEVVGDACSNAATLNMTTSAYNIMINQDCNLYEKKIDAQREAVMKTVRQAEKYLRDARLEEYRAHNSQDVNECISKVKTAILQDTACGENYKRCLDYSGKYINTSTGEPIYSPDLFGLTDIIKLDGSADVLGANPDFNRFLDERRMFATTALDSCRDLADVVWSEFKRSALIEISQAQDEKIEQVKDSCVSTMAECYDNQSGQLKEMDTTTAQASGAISASAARAMCKEKVDACSNLYGGGASGLAELQNFVDTVDSVKINEGCTEALTNYVQNDLCAPTANESGRKYPWGCRGKENELGVDNGLIMSRANVYCNTGTDLNNDLVDVAKTVETLVDNIKAELIVMYDIECDNVGGVWSAKGNADTARVITSNISSEFYSNLFGSGYSEDKLESGVCYANSVKLQCELQDEATGSKGLAKYDDASGKCVFSADWYKAQCEKIGGYYDEKTSSCLVLEE